MGVAAFETFREESSDLTKASLHLNTQFLPEPQEIPSSWSESLAVLQKALDPQIFAAWIKPLRLEKIEELGQQGSSESCLAIELIAPNKFSAEHVKQHYSELLANTLANITGSNGVVLRFKVSSRSAAPYTAVSQETNGVAPLSSPLKNSHAKNLSGTQKEKSSDSRSRRSNGDAANLNSKYRFQNFIVGACNQFAHAVSMRVTENLGSNYNPLFIYGGVGLGKTHLANAIGNASKQQGKKVLYISSETFVNELISSLRSNKMQSFKEKFRSLDLLIIDDIQFIIGKERTQEEFFHTFNALYNKRGQLVITSDKIPQELTGLEERLKTRFSSGLSADLQAPEFETRVAILLKKAETESFPLSIDVAHLLAEKIDSNVRELEGALNRLHAFSALHRSPVTLDLAEEALRSIIPEKKREITIELIQKIVAEKFNLSLKDLLGKRRTQHIATPRHIAMYLCRKLTTSSYPEIGSLFGGRDHSTVIHANKVVCEKVNNDDDFKKTVDVLEKRLKG